MNIKKGSLHRRQNQSAGPEQQQHNVVVVAGEEKKSDHRQRGRCAFGWKYIVGMQALLAAAVLQFFHTPLNINIARGGNNTPLNVHVREGNTTATATAGSSDRIKVFYNVYANPADDAAFQRAKDIVKEQRALLEHHQVFIRSIGGRFKVDNATHIQHDEEGSEFGTLKLLWDHCLNETDNPNEKVVYLHNKGSFHPKKKNDLLRKWLTRAALSKECATMPSSCNVCSWRFSPLPHPHTSGNMWAARCEYIKKLINPMKFQRKMAQLYKNTGDSSWTGTGRFAAEHWVHSHPSIQACDLSTSGFLWGYNNIPKFRDEFVLEAAPRYDWDVFFQPSVKGQLWMQFAHRWAEFKSLRIAEYKSLYNETPPHYWFGWKFYGENSSDSIHVDLQRPTALDSAEG